MAIDIITAVAVAAWGVSVALALRSIFIDNSDNSK